MPCILLIYISGENQHATFGIYEYPGNLEKDVHLLLLSVWEFKRLTNVNFDFK